MSDEIRYEVGAEIARGDFATVYRGRDLRLDRDVAIKQLHHQYLDHPKLTERYWQEAQFLARLEHPHVMTIYDVVPEKGWLILELMKGSLKDQLGKRPIHLKDLRLTIIFAARALSFFQQQNILHGDVKPSNLLIDRNNVVKLGDFGIARRLQSDEGSAIKGTTRYIAPEVVSDKFGPVGPHSDIYSLGFSAYELLCGERFESLFPGLHMFGRDQQLAWIMWHSAPDRRLPRINDVLEGVPDQLAAVIEKMTNKDPAQRYRSADEIIADLSNKETIPSCGPSPEERAEAERVARRARQKRYAAVGALLVSLLVSTLMLIPRGGQQRDEASPTPTEGVVGKVVADDNKVYLKSEDVILVDKNDRILLDGAVSQLSDLEANDKLSIQYLDGPRGRIKWIEASRVKATTFDGRITAIDAAGRQLTLVSADGKSRTFAFDGQTPVSLNGSAATAAALQPGDMLTAKYWKDEEGGHAVSLDARRKLTATGVVDSFDVGNRQLTFSREGTATTMRVADDCSITINGRDNLAGRRPTLKDLESGDRIVSMTYDTRVRQIDLEREISDLVRVWSVDAPANRLEAELDGERLEISVEQAEIKYQDRRIGLPLLRKGDRLAVVHDSPDYKNVSATSIEVSELVRDPLLAALVICQQTYDDIQITPYKYAARDAELVREKLDVGARVPENQLSLLKDLPAEKLMSAIDSFLTSQGEREQLIVYFVGQAYVAPNSGTTYLAPRDFQLDNMADTGLPLRDLITAMEGVQAREKALLLDTCHQVSPVESQLQPATGNQVRAAMVGDAVSKSVIVLGSCDNERRVVVDDESKHGRFGMELAHALEGRADTDANHRISTNELFRYLREQLTAAQQVPVRFQPDTRPPRLRPEAADAVRGLLSQLIRRSTSGEFDKEYENAAQLCGNQPDARLAYALVKLKTGRTGESLDLFYAVLESHPDALVAYHAAAYQHLAKKEWPAAADLLAGLVQRIAALENPRDTYVSHLLDFAGTSRSFLASVDSDSVRAEAIDAAVGKLGTDQKAAYENGRRQFQERHEQLPETQRGSIRRFYTFDFDAVKQYMLKQLQ